MIYFFRVVSSLSFLITVITLIRPRSGWVRLALFIPKLFSGTFIVLFSILGLVSAGAAWFVSRDYISLSLGVTAFTVGSRHLFRLIARSRCVVHEIGARRSSRDLASSSMLSYPWIGYWHSTEDAYCQKDVVVSQPDVSTNQILADIWSPSEKENTSGICIVFLHGSGWHYADKDFGTRPFFGHLAAQGHVVVDVAYPLAPAVNIHGMMGDIKSSINWVKQHAKELNISKERVVLMGGSAGGHLALLAAFSSAEPSFDPPELSVGASVCGVVSYYGPTDLRAQFNRFGELPGLTGRERFERMFMSYLEARTGFQVIPVHGLIPSLLGGSPQEIPELYDLASPITHVSESSPPTLQLYGTHDFSGVGEQVVRLDESLRQSGVTSYLFELPDCEHGFDLYKPQWSPAAQAATFVTERFLASLL